MTKCSRPIATLGWLLIAGMALWAVRAAAQESHPNLSGIWKWIPEKSQVSGPPASNRRAKIEQQGDDLSLTIRDVYRIGEEFRKYHFTIGTGDNKNELLGFPMTSQVGWKDGALSVESAVKTPDGELHMSDTWTLSADGQTLTFHQTRTLGGHPPREDTIVYAKQAEADWEPPQPPKMAEDVFKNIQVFKGVPAPEVMSAMRSFTRALGVQCEFCHVEHAFEKDDHPEKRTARKMILMARQINKDNFGGGRMVTCWTCHRGSTEPQSAPQ